MNVLSTTNKPMSLRLRLLLMVALIMVAALGLVGLALDAAYYRSSEAALQARMKSLVYVVLAATEAGDDGVLMVDDDPGDPRLGQPGSGLYAFVRSDLTEWSSPSTLGVDLPGLLSFEAGKTLFSAPDSTVDFYSFHYGVAWELENQRLVPATVSILVDPQEIRAEVRAFRAGLWRSLVTAGFILLLAQLLLLAVGLRPLRKISQEIAGIESGDLDRLEGRYPKELESLTRNLNNLLSTEKANQKRYRNALDSLAHSLKTPLSVIRSSLPADSDAKAALIENAVDDMQLLIATRLQRAAGSARRSIAPAVDVETQVQRLIRSIQHVYSQDLINIDVNIELGLQFYGEQRDLLEVIGNLLDNACKYGSGRVRLSMHALDSADPRAGVFLQFEDNGPGIAEHVRQQLLQRGVRGDERVEGHGLGLAIVLEIVSAYNGAIAIDESELGGALFSVSLSTA